MTLIVEWERNVANYLACTIELVDLRLDQSFQIFRRTLNLTLGNVGSNWAKALSGLPQGSVLGPLLF